MKYLSLLAFSVVLAGCAAPPTSVATESSKPEITTQVVIRQDLAGYEFFDGKLVIPTNATATAFSPFETSVVSVSSGVGKYVNRGEPIVKLTVEGADEAAEAAKANANNAEAAYSSEKASSSAPVLEAERMLSEARAAERAAREDVAAGGSSDLALATSIRKDAEAAVIQAKAQLRATLQPSRTMANQAAEDLIDAKADARKGVVRAPISGTIVTFEAKPGLAAKPSQPLATIVNYEMVRVQATIPAELKETVVKGASVIISMSGRSSDPIDGKVMDVSVLPPVEGEKSAGYLAVIAFKNPRAMAQYGTIVKRVGVKTGQAQGVLTVPVGAVSAKDGKSFVSVKSGAEWLEKEVVTGISDGVAIEIKSGLAEGTEVRVVTPPLEG